MILVVTYRLQTGADEAAFVRLDAELQASFYYQQPGIERRTTARSADGGWVTISNWDDAEAAASARAAANAQGVIKRLAEFIDMTTLVGTSYDEL